jgi:hypothetical protein
MPKLRGLCSAPNWAAISFVRSVLPVSTMTISSNTLATDERQFERFFSSSLTIIVNESVAVLHAIFLATDETRIEHGSGWVLEEGLPSPAPWR